MGPYGESRPLRRHVQTGSHAECRHRVIITKSPPGPPLLWSSRQSNGILPAVLQQQLVQQSSVQRKLLASSPASQGPSPPVAPLPAPFRLDSPGDHRTPGPHPHRGQDPGSRVPGGLPAPPRAETARAGGGAAPARRPPGRPHAPSRPRSFPAFPI